jgi:tetratricopeptide (TPR) repeat protein
MTPRGDDLPPDVEALFAAALELPAVERSAFLDVACAGEPAMREDLTSLLEAHDTANDFLDAPLFAHAGVVEGLPSDSTTADPLVGERIGPFTLEEQIGQGGMGVVYRAERKDGEFTQRVAVKVVDLSLRRPEVLQRFKSERQILASLSHPHIVGLVDGGVTPSGRAYLVMEYVEGVPITTYCATRRLPLADRLALVQTVCGAVQYAHQHGIVHRDLKPGNILVTPDGVPKVLDFGIAKLLHADADHDGTNTTESGLRPLTPNYASPEQFRGLPVTTSSDIYALGVLLYELMTGEPPYQLNHATLEAMLHAVVDVDPRRPSAVTTIASTDTRPYAHKLLAGDLDAIALKALRKAPTDRYASPRELADDLDRWRRGRPVVAREPSFSYLMTRLVRRHRAAAIAAAVSLVALVAALGVSLWQTRIARAEKARATARFDDAHQLANGLLFRLERTVGTLPGSAPVRQQIVTEALTYLERLSRDPAGDDALTIDLARGYHRVGDIQGNPSSPNLGDRDGAIASLRRGIALLTPLTERPGPPREAMLELARSNLSLGLILSTQDHRDDSRRASTDAAAICRRLLAVDPKDSNARRGLASAELNLGLLGQPTGDDLPHFEASRVLFEGLLVDDPANVDSQRNVALVEKYIGAYYERHWAFGEALPHFLRAKTIDEGRLSAKPDDRTAQFDVAIDLSNVANSLYHSNRAAEAAATYEQSLRMRTALAAFDQNDVLARSRVAFVHTRLSAVYGTLGRYSEAIAHAHDAVRLAESMVGLDVEHRLSFANDLSDLGIAEARIGDAAAACAAFGRAADAVAPMKNNPATTPETQKEVTAITETVDRGTKGCPSRSAIAK